MVLISPDNSRSNSSEGIHRAFGCGVGFAGLVFAGCFFGLHGCVVVLDAFVGVVAEV